MQRSVAEPYSFKPKGPNAYNLTAIWQPCLQVLSNPKTRETYDKFGEQGIKDGGGGMGCCCNSPTDFFDMFFSGGGRRRPWRTKDLIRQMQVRLTFIRAVSDPHNQDP